MHDEFSILVGQERKRIVAPIVNDMASKRVINEKGDFQVKKFSQMTDVEKVKWLQDEYGKARDIAVEKFFAAHPELVPPEKSKVMQIKEKILNKLNN